MEKTVVRIDNASVRYNLAMQNRHGLKDYLRAVKHRELLFQEFIALRDISLTIRQGESWGIVGKNGSGKSTLLKLITGILRPYKGTVNVNGTVAPLLELGAGFDGELTGRENIMMNGLILGMSEKDIQARFDEIVDFAEIEKFLDVPLKNYSSGMKSRLGFSIATCASADILIADEVLATGDRAFQAKCEKRMQELLQDGTTLLFVSHS
ncbi:MAG: ABC transporter ATP-binding protein, partial [Aristaeellaceae bacterium]